MGLYKEYFAAYGGEILFTQPQTFSLATFGQKNIGFVATAYPIGKNEYFLPCGRDVAKSPQQETA